MRALPTVAWDTVSTAVLGCLTCHSTDSDGGEGLLSVV